MQILKCVTTDVILFCQSQLLVYLQKSRFVMKQTIRMTEKASILLPPPHVRGMKKLDKTLFSKSVKIPCLKIEEASLGLIVKSLKPFLLKMERLKPVQDVPDCKPGFKTILLNPDIITSFDQFQLDVQQKLHDCGITAECFESRDVEITYDNWKCDTILSSVLPEDEDKSTGYSRIGHIVHLNLREHLSDYRFLIGQVLLDKLKGVTCVVNKTEIIGNTYRNFNMEVLAGENNMVAKVKENGCTYEFNFADVFWNPRLCTEHERLVAKLPQGSWLYDVFAGVGPFAILAARKKKCHVLANDLNSQSYKWLQHNIRLNKVENSVKAFNLDGRQFIEDTIKCDVISRWNDYRAAVGVQTSDWPEMHIAMNLPAMATEFLDAFRGWLSDHLMLSEQTGFKCPTIHCYMFCKDDNFVEPCIQRVETVLGTSLDRQVTEVFHVRSVAPNKEMIRLSFILSKEVCFRQVSDCISKLEPALRKEKPVLNEPNSKRLCT